MINFENHDDDPNHMPSFSEAVIRGMVDNPASIFLTIVSVACVGIVTVDTIDIVQKYSDVPDGYASLIATGLVIVAANSFVIGLNMSNSLTRFLIKIVRRRSDLFDEFLKINEAIEKDLMTTRQDLRRTNLENYRLQKRLEKLGVSAEEPIDNAKSEAVE